jgi:hypothetical protein
MGVTLAACAGTVANNASCGTKATESCTPRVGPEGSVRIDTPDLVSTFRCHMFGRPRFLTTHSGWRGSTGTIDSVSRSRSTCQRVSRRRSPSPRTAALLATIYGLAVGVGVPASAASAPARPGYPEVVSMAPKNVTETSATLEPQINPEGSETSWEIPLDCQAPLPSEAHGARCEPVTGGSQRHEGKLADRDRAGRHDRPSARVLIYVFGDRP